MKAYEVNPGYQTHLVVCDSIAEAEKIYNEKLTRPKGRVERRVMARQGGHE